MPASAILQHPERIHPALWRASQIVPPRRSTIQTGHAALDHALPGGGWPLGTLIEILHPHLGMGELLLLQPALARLGHRRRILLLDPPNPPSMQCWANWGLPPQAIVWLRTRSIADHLWAAEQIIRHDTCSALLCWTNQAPDHTLLRLQRLAQRRDTFLVLLRPESVAHRASPAPLRLALRLAPQGLSIDILKLCGPGPRTAIDIHLYSNALDLPAPARTRLPGRPSSPSAALYTASHGA